MKQKIDYHARLVIYGLPTMCEANRIRIIAWLTNIAYQVRHIDDKRIDFGNRYTLKLMK